MQPRDAIPILRDIERKRGQVRDMINNVTVLSQEQRDDAQREIAEETEALAVAIRLCEKASSQ